MSVELLTKIRKLNIMLQRTGFQPVIFSDICKRVGELTASNVIISSKKGKILGVFTDSDYGLVEEFVDIQVGNYLEESMNKKFLSVISTRENTDLKSLNITSDENTDQIPVVLTPIESGGERIGTLLLYKNQIEYDVEDIIMIEYAATVVGMEIIRALNEESAEEIRKLTIVKSAIGTLSYSELEAIMHIFDELDGTEGLLVASKIADRVGITRSVIVNALRKFESAGVIESRSLGMKGTYIRVLNTVLIEELEKLRK